MRQEVGVVVVGRLVDAITSARYSAGFTPMRA
jgi:hypothetical protein